MTRDAEKILGQMPKLLSRLKSQTPRTIWCPLRKRWQLEDIPKKGVYVFYCKGKPVYVGRSDQVADRIKSHGTGSKSGSASATFAVILTRNLWGIWNGPYWDGPFPKKKKEREKSIKIKKGKKTKEIRLDRGSLLADNDILNDFKQQAKKVRSMKLSVIEIEDPYEQAIFEVYAALALDTPYNDFRNH